MTSAERLIGEIVAASRIPSRRRRAEIARELRAHVEDLVSAQQQNGCAEDEVERLLLERFGDPREVARQFAWVYRHERAVLLLGAFLISTILVSLLISTATIATQSAVAVTLGAPISGTLASRHTAIEALDILATAAAYIGLISLGKSFGRSLGAIAAIAAAFFVIFTASGLPSWFLVFGLLNGAMLRGVQIAIPHPTAQIAAGPACFAALGLVFFHPSSTAAWPTAASWLIMGTAYYLMTHLAARVQRAFAARF